MVTRLYGRDIRTGLLCSETGRGVFGHSHGKLGRFSFFYFYLMHVISFVYLDRGNPIVCRVVRAPSELYLGGAETLKGMSNIFLGN